jgi:hypothetical protein
MTARMVSRQAAESNGNSATALADPPSDPASEAPKRGRGRPPKQQILPGEEFDTVREIDEVGQEYVAAMLERVGMLEVEKALKKKLVEVMKKHDLEAYRIQGYMVLLTHIVEDEIKLKKVRQAKPDGKQS